MATFKIGDALKQMVQENTKLKKGQKFSELLPKTPSVLQLLVLMEKPQLPVFSAIFYTKAVLT